MNHQLKISSLLKTRHFKRQITESDIFTNDIILNYILETFSYRKKILLLNINTLKLSKLSIEKKELTTRNTLSSFQTKTIPRAWSFINLIRSRKQSCFFYLFDIHVYSGVLFHKLAGLSFFREYKLNIYTVYLNKYTLYLVLVW